MPSKSTVKAARKAKREGKSPTTQAGAFVHEEIEHIRHGKHGARSTKQAIAIGLSKARRAGVKLPIPKKGTTSKATREQARKDNAVGRERPPHKVSAARSRASSRRLKKYGSEAVSTSALSKHAKEVAKRPSRRRATKAKAS
jgi:hypothetical protein